MNNMTKKGYIIFIIVFAIFYLLTQILLFEAEISLSLIISSLISAVLALAFIYIYIRFSNKTRHNKG